MIIAILAVAGAYTYTGMRERSVVSTLYHNLASAIDAIEADHVGKRVAPTGLPTSFRASDGVTISMTSALPGYSDLSPVQNGVLFHTICGDLVAEGYGQGENQGGQQDKYITACNVYNHTQIQVNSAWNSRSFNTPVDSGVLPAVVASINYNDSWRPERDAIEKLFYQTWHDRFLSLGGTYPVISFWDSWASPGNGVMEQEPPSVDATTGGEYCIEAVHESLPDKVYHLNRDDRQPTAGHCAI